MYDDAWSFLEIFLPNYSHRDDVLESDVLYRYLIGDDVSNDDLEWIESEFSSDKKKVAEYLSEMEGKLFTSAIKNFYSIW